MGWGRAWDWHWDRDGDGDGDGDRDGDGIGIIGIDNRHNRYRDDSNSKSIMPTTVEPGTYRNHRNDLANIKSRDCHVTTMAAD